jgi:hypothetical protein
MLTAIKKPFWVLAALGALASCAAAPPPDSAPPALQQAALIDPDDQLLVRDLDSYITASNGPANTRYEFSRIDLDHDGRRDGLALLVSPYYKWCNDNGCQMVLMKARNDGFDPVSVVSPVRGPITVAENTTNGWRDLIVRVSGRSNVGTKNAALRYNGETYPLSPVLAPNVANTPETQTGIQIFP